MTLRGWEGNHRSGDVLAMYHMTLRFIYLQPQGPSKISTSLKLNFGHGPPLGYLYFCLLLRHSRKLVKLLYR